LYFESRRSYLVVLAALLLECVLLAAPLMSRVPFEWDTAQFCLATLHFDIRLHQPHPPGYLLWVSAVKVVNLLTHDPVVSQNVLSLVLTALGGVFVFALISETVSVAAGWSAALLLLASPPVVLHAAAGATYPCDFFFSALLGWLGWKVWHGEARLAGLMAVALAAHAGFRQSGALLLAPLVLTAYFRALGARPVALFAAGLPALALFSAWYVPLVRSAGGLAEYHSYSANETLTYLRGHSLLFGARFYTWAHNTRLAALTLALASAPLLAAGMLMRTGTAARAAGQGHPRAGWFALLWLAPGLLYAGLLHAPKSGYLLLSLPPAAFLLSRWLLHGCERLALPGRATRLLGGFAVALGLAWFPYHLLTGLPFIGEFAAAARRAVPPIALRAGESTLAVRRVARELVSDPESTLVLVAYHEFEGPSLRVLTWVLPECWVGGVAPPHFLLIRRRRTTAAQALPHTIREILWVTLDGPVPPEAAGAFPATRTLYRNGLIRLHLSRLELGAPRAFTLGGVRIELPAAGRGGSGYPLK
jgi:hypothetical protein